MFCDRCGANLVGSTNFCPSCGRAFGTAQAEVPPAIPAVGRVAKHLRRLGVFWLIYAASRVLSGLTMRMFQEYDWWYLDYVPPFVPGFIRELSLVFLIIAAIGLIAGWGLIQRKPWARTLAIVLGVLLIFKFPVGTALGIYTLWVLGPAGSDAEYRLIQRVA